MNGWMMLAMMGAQTGGESAQPQSGCSCLFGWTDDCLHFMLIRPQKRREKGSALLSAVRRATACRLPGLPWAANVKDKTLVVKIADGVKVHGAVSQSAGQGRNAGRRGRNRRVGAPRIHEYAAGRKENEDA